MIKGLAAYFYISIPDQVENGNYFKNVNDKWIRLQDPFSAQIYQNVQIQGKDEAIKLLLEEFLLKDTILFPFSGEIQKQILAFLPQFTRLTAVQNA